MSKAVQYEDDYDGCWACENQDNCANCELYKKQTKKQARKKDAKERLRDSQPIIRFNL